MTQDNWDGGVQPDVKAEALPTALAQIRTNVPYAHAPLKIQSAQAAYKSDLANAGATLPKRDPVDTRVINDVRTGQASAKAGPDAAENFSHVGYSQHVIDAILGLIPKGIITNPAQVGGYPSYQGTPYQDSDGDGYTNIEKFIHGLDPRAQKTDWTNLKNNVDKRNK